MQFNTLRDLLIEQLQDLHNAETQLTEALPQMAAAATSVDLKEAFNLHLEETRNHVKRLETIFTEIGAPAIGEECEAMQGLVHEGGEIIKATGDPNVKDAALIAAAQRVEHYEMAGYGSCRAFASHLGLASVADLLQETLDEEGAADKKLTRIAEGSFFFGTEGVNNRAETPRELTRFPESEVMPRNAAEATTTGTITHPNVPTTPSRAPSSTVL